MPRLLSPVPLVLAVLAFALVLVGASAATGPHPAVTA
jgi:hypothetical protein